MQNNMDQWHASIYVLKRAESQTHSGIMHLQRHTHHNNNGPLPKKAWEQHRLRCLLVFAGMVLLIDHARLQHPQSGSVVYAPLYMKSWQSPAEPTEWIWGAVIVPERAQR